MSTRVTGRLNRAVVAGGRIYSEGTAATAELLAAIPEREFWDGVDDDTTADGAGQGGNQGGNEPSDAEKVYLEKKKDELEAEVKSRNEGRADDAKIAVDEPGNKPELAKALVTDDENNAGA